MKNKLSIVYILFALILASTFGGIGRTANSNREIVVSIRECGGHKFIVTGNYEHHCTANTAVFEADDQILKIRVVGTKSVEYNTDGLYKSCTGSVGGAKMSCGDFEVEVWQTVDPVTENPSPTVSPPVLEFKSSDWGQFQSCGDAQFQTEGQLHITPNSYVEKGKPDEIFAGTENIFTVELVLAGYYPTGLNIGLSSSGTSQIIWWLSRPGEPQYMRGIMQATPELGKVLSVKLPEGVFLLVKVPERGAKYMEYTAVSHLGNCTNTLATSPTP